MSFQLLLAETNRVFEFVEACWSILLYHSYNSLPKGENLQVSGLFVMSRRPLFHLNDLHKNILVLNSHFSFTLNEN